MKGIAVLMCAVTAATAASFARLVYEEWTAFKLEHQKRYDSVLEDQYRMKIYAEYRRKVAKHNQLFARGLVGYSQKLNKYSDLTHREFLAAMTGYDGGRNDTAGRDEPARRYRPPPRWTPPEEVDWRWEGAVTEVEDQRMCLSCWAFSANGALEAQHFLRSGRLVPLSEQNLIDCSRGHGNRGCDGGSMIKAYRYIQQNRGVDTETSYPYEAMDDTCRYDPRSVGAADAGYRVVRDEWTLRYAVAAVGPISAAMCGSLESFRHYERGVYDDVECSSRRKRNHAALIVGYGEEGGRKYWLLKNSWGRTWGIEGYAKLARGHNNLCGISSEASFPLIDP